ncbi:hypothetical protein MLD52_03565 [Puniceicoccaceae bacterium K14]|nr:hypothetical protein [Puniceicoccaceae bacterium K14]
MNFIRIFFLCIVALLGAGGIGYILDKRDEIDGVCEEILTLEQLVAENDYKLLTLRGLEKQVSKIDQSIESLVARKERMAVDDIDSSVEFGDVTGWVEQTQRLGRFLSENEQYRIAEMNLLSALDWLAVTNGKILKTEAEYREALSGLRSVAKMGALSVIRKALKEYENANPDNPIEDLGDLIAFTNGEIGLGTLQRYKLKTGESDDDVEIIFADEGDFKEFVEKGRVDKFWDTFSIIRIGTSSVGGESSFAIGGRSYDDSKELIEEAISKFKSENYREPEKSEDIESYLENNEALEILPEMFEALTNVVEQ